MARVKLGDVAREYKQTNKNSIELPSVGLEHLTPGEIELKTWDEGVDTTFTKMFKKGQMLFGRRRAYLKKAALAPFDGICSGDITVIEAISDKILPELLPFVIQNDLLFDYAVGKSAGSLSPRVKWADLKNYEFELPDMEQQSRLTDLLQAAYESKQAYQRLIQKTDEMVKSQFIEMFGDQNTDYDKLKIKDVCELINGKAFKPADWTKSGHPIVRIQNLNDPTVEFNYCQCEIEAKYWIDDGTLLFAWSGTPGTSFGSFIWNRGPAVLNQHIFRVVPYNLVDKFFLKCSFEGHMDEIIDKAHGGVGLRHITKKDLENIELAIPPLQVQKSFVEFAQQADKSKFAILNVIQPVHKQVIILENVLMKA